MKIVMLGTGNALVTECYNTCFVLDEDGKYLLVDGGGGNQILKRLKEQGIGIAQVHDIFATHKHVDHVLGVLWMLRMITQMMNAGKYEGEARVYAHKEMCDMLGEMAKMLLPKKQADQIGKRVHLVALQDGQTLDVIGHKMQCFDIHSGKDKQFGFRLSLSDGKWLACCGDEPYNEVNQAMVQGSEWLLHEAFCLYSERDEFKPYEKNHSTVKEACETAERLDVKNLLLYHTEDKNLEKRKELYTQEGRQYYHGNLFVPDDMEVITL